MRKRFIVWPLLVMMLCLQMTGFAAEDVKTVPSEERGFLESLGINFYQSEGDNEFVTRGEYIYTAVQLLGMKHAIGVDMPFQDVDDQKDYYSAVGYALKTGLIASGDMFYPEREITYNEAFKIAVSALGRDYYAKRAGGYPTGYLTEAARCGVSRGITQTEDGKLLRQDFYKLLKNLSEADLLTAVSIDSDGNTGYYDSSTILREYFNIDCTEGIITADSRTGLYEKNGAVPQGYIKIGDEKYACSFEAPLGCNVKAYIRTENGEKNVVYLQKHNNEIYRLELKDIVSADKRQVIYNTENNTKHLNLAVPAAFIINGTADTAAKLSDYAGKEGYALFTDCNADGKIDTVAVWHTQMLYVGSVTNQKIYDKNGAIVIDCDDETEIVIDGKRTENAEESVKAGMLLSVCASPDKSFYRIASCKGSAEGKVTGLDYGEKEIYIDGEKYSYNAYFAKYDLSSVRLGMKIKVLLDTNGAAACKSYAEGTGMQYGYLTAAKRGAGLKNDVSVKLFAEDGKEMIYELADKVRVDSESKTQNEAYAILCPGSAANMQLIRYSLNADGKIKAIDTKASTGGVLLGSEDGENSLIQYQFPAAGLHDTIYYIPETGIVHPYFSITNETKIFNIGLSDTSCRMRDKAWLAEHKQLVVGDMEIYDVTSTGNAGALLLFNRAAVGSEVSEGSDSGVIYSVSEAVDSEGENGYKLVVYNDSAYHDLYITDEKVLEAFKDASGAVTLKRGDYVRYDREASGNVTSLKRDYEADGEKVNVEFSNQLYFTYYYGKVFDSAGSVVTMMPENITGLVSGSGAADARYTIKLPEEITVFDSKRKLIYSISADEMIPYTQSAAECDKILVKANNGNIHDVVVYR